MKLETTLYLCTTLLALLLGGCGGGDGGSAERANNGPIVILSHQGLAYDQSRQVYYATVSSTDPSRGNRIATIDRAGTITATTSPIGSSPSSIAISRDGSRLYVGLRGTGEIAQYALPSFTMLTKLALPVDSSLGQMYAEQISVSPIDPNTFAVSLAYDRASPRHAGVALVKNMSILPTRTPSHTGSNRIVFDVTGEWVYGFNNETTEFGVRKLQPAADGLAQQSVVPVTEANFDWDIESFGNIVMVGSKAFSANTLSLRGVVSGASFHCVGISANSKVACFSNDFGKLVVAETVNFTRLGEVLFPETSQTAAYRLVAGPSGQIAASALGSGRIYLITSETLQ